MDIIARELARFLDIPLGDVYQRLKSYHVSEAAEAWNKADPKTPAEVEEFYKATDHYLYELATWNYESEVYREWNAPLLSYHGKKVLEIGAGLGTLCIQLAYSGNDVVYCDINPTLQKFAAQRFVERGLVIPIVKELKGLRDFDIVVCNDFFEHIHKDALPKLLKQISGVLRDGGFVYHRSNFKQQDIFPMHFDHSEYFEQMAKDAKLAARANGDLVKGGESRGVHVGVPCLGSIPDEWFYSFLSLDKPPGTKLTKVGSRPADAARNEIIGKFEKDWLFLMDADQAFHPETLRKLLSWDLPIVTGLYFKSPGNPVPHIYKYAYQEQTGPVKDAHLYAAMIDPIAQFLFKHKDALKGQGAVVLPSTKEDLLECDGIGGGCILVHRQVLDAIEPPYFEYNPGTFVGEDFYFSRKVQAAGFKIFCDPGVICGHRMKGLIGAEHFLNFITSKGKNLDCYPYPWGEG